MRNRTEDCVSFRSPSPLGRGQGRGRKRDGFTLIELLVVITIIVVLLALLTPALDKAIYQAELAVCAATLDGLATAATTYAMDHKRRYPYRTGVDNGGQRRPSELKIFLPGDARDGDDRPVIRDYIPLNKM